jgi:hypothetical protein
MKALSPGSLQPAVAYAIWAFAELTPGPSLWNDFIYANALQEERESSSCLSSL